MMNYLSQKWNCQGYVQCGEHWHMQQGGWAGNWQKTKM